jgi:hypothetical protein
MRRPVSGCVDWNATTGDIGANNAASTIAAENFPRKGIPTTRLSICLCLPLRAFTDKVWN